VITWPNGFSRQVFLFEGPTRKDFTPAFAYRKKKTRLPDTAGAELMPVRLRPSTEWIHAGVECRRKRTQ